MYLIELVQTKLLGRNPWNKVQGDLQKKILDACCLVGIRVGLDVDLGSPSRASEMVAMHMRWLGGISKDRQITYTNYGSEPTLVEAAAINHRDSISRISEESFYLYVSLEVTVA